MRSAPGHCRSAASYGFLVARDPEVLLRRGMSRFGIPYELQAHALRRFADAGRPPVVRFAPYMHHVLEVEAFLYTAIGADLIGHARTSNAAGMAYLYYLPFCRVFTSNDSLHERTVPLFLEPHQSFVVELRKDLARIDRHYSASPEEIRGDGLLQFAVYPPPADGSVVTALWDKHCPIWRQHGRPQLPQPPGE